MLYPLSYGGSRRAHLTNAGLSRFACNTSHCHGTTGNGTGGLPDTGTW
jgi:hypothetical protein